MRPSRGGFSAADAAFFCRFSSQSTPITPGALPAQIGRAATMPELLPWKFLPAREAADCQAYPSVSISAG